MIRVLLTSMVALFLCAGTADAAEVVLAVKAVIGWVSALGTVGTALLQIAVGSAMSLIAKAKMRKAQRDAGGLQTEVTLSGGTNSETFILGYYATSGNWVCPPLSRGDRNNILTYVIDLAGMSGHTLEEVFVNGEKLTFEAPIAHGVTVKSVADSFKGLVSVTYFDGSQTAAPEVMLTNYGAHPDFPWSADMVGRGRCFVVAEFVFDDKVFSGLPQMRFGVRGIALRDPRDGVTRQTDNLALLSHAVLSGITLPDGTRWGGEALADDLPLSVWAAAMNEADRAIDIAGGGSEPQFRGGFEVKIAEVEPAEVLERFMDACTGDLAEEGGTWHVRIGAPALPSAFLTDADLIIDAPMSLSPFASLSEAQNGLTLKFPNPAAAWEVSEAERILRPDLEAKDDGRRLMTDLSLSACPFALQVQRVGAAYINDARRDVTHSVTLPPDFVHLPPLSVVAWTSDHNQYVAKQFSIEQKQVQPHDLLAAVELREIDPADHAWSPADELPLPSIPQKATTPAPYVIPDFAPKAVTLKDGDGTARRVGIELGPFPLDLDGVEWRLRIGDEVVASGVAMDVGSKLLITEGLLPGQEYLASARAAGGGLVDWTDWKTVITEDLRLAFADMAPEVEEVIQGAKDFAQEARDFALGEANSAKASADLVADIAEEVEAAKTAVQNSQQTVTEKTAQAVQAAGEAQGHAGAASESETNAGSSATAAGQHAAATLEDRQKAETAKGEAEAAKAAAVEAVSDADGHRQSAAQSATVSAEARDATIVINGNMLFEFGVQGWNCSKANWYEEVSPGLLRAIGHDAWVNAARKFAVDTSRKYRVRLRCKAEGGKSHIFSGVVTYDADGNVQSSGVGTHRYCAALNVVVPDDNQWHVYEGVITGEGLGYHSEFRPGTKFASPTFIAGYTSSGLTETGSTLLISECSIEDVTESEVAKGHANASSTSAQQAKASETAAGQEATAASQDRQLAQTAKGHAEAARDASAGSASDADGHKQEAQQFSIASASTGSGNLAPNGSLGDPALWVSHGASSNSYVKPNEAWSADVDGNGTPGFDKAGAGSFWNYSRDPILIDPNAIYRLSVWVYRSGASAANYLTWANPSTFSKYSYRSIGTTFPVGEWTEIVQELAGSTLLGVLDDVTTPGEILMGISLDHGGSGGVKAKAFRVENITESTAAKGHADASATSAQQAKASETEAGQKASAAETSRQTASTKAAEAKASQEAAAASVSTADGHAQAAATHASEALATLVKVKKFEGNFDFRDGFEGWNVSGAEDTHWAQTHHAVQGGRVARLRGWKQVYWDTPIPVSSTRKYRVKARIRCLSTSPGNSRIYVGLITRDGNGDVETASPGTHRYCAASSVQVPNDNVWREYEGIITGAGNQTHNQFRPNTAFAHPLILANYNQSNDYWLEVDYLTIEDITEADALTQIVQAAVADLAGKLAASVVMRAKAGTAGAVLELVAGSNPSGAKSSAKLSADDIDLIGKVTAQHFHAGSLAAAGLAIFGGALKSANFNGSINSAGSVTNPGTQGYALGQDGTLALTNLIAREAVQVGAVSDGVTHVAATPIRTGYEHVVFEREIGPTALGQFWNVAFSWEYRSPGRYSYPYDGGTRFNVVWTEAYVERALRIGGVWQPWKALKWFDWSRDNTWWQAEHVVTFQAEAENTKFRLRTRLNGTPNVDLQNNVRNVGFVAKTVLK